MNTRRFRTLKASVSSIVVLWLGAGGAVGQPAAAQSQASTPADV